MGVLREERFGGSGRGGEGRMRARDGDVMKTAVKRD